VSEQYQNHLDSEERVEREVPETGEMRPVWVQKKKRNDLFVCECYIAMQIDQAGLILQEITTEHYDEPNAATTEAEPAGDVASPGEGFNKRSDE
jgi:hypothetical protein